MIVEYKKNTSKNDFEKNQLGPFDIEKLTVDT